ncbi:hypothetical protein ACWGID_40160 [Kribbella sp. NPDC054772]
MGAPEVSSGRGLLLFGPPTGGLDTITAILPALDSRFVLHQRVKVGNGQSDGYRIVDLDEFVRAEEADEFIHTYSRYGALYGIDRASLVDVCTDTAVPIVHVGQLDALDAIRAATPNVSWTSVCLWCSRAEAALRLCNRADPDPMTRLQAWDEAAAELLTAGADTFDMTVNTATLPPELTARMIAQSMALDPMPDPAKAAVARRARKLFGQPRFVGYLRAAANKTSTALDLYDWNATISAALWEVLGHVEVTLRNAMVAKLSERHQRRRLRGSWLDDPGNDLTAKAHEDIAKARLQVRRKNKQLTDGQIIAELSFGFWRFLLAHRYMTTIWPDLSYAFPYAPDRQLVTLEAPVLRLWEIRNRIAHNERIWTEPIRQRHDDALLVLGYIDPSLAEWVSDRSRVPALLARCPINMPQP